MVFMRWLIKIVLLISLIVEQVLEQGALWASLLMMIIAVKVEKYEEKNEVLKHSVLKSSLQKMQKAMSTPRHFER